MNQINTPLVLRVVTSSAPFLPYLETKEKCKRKDMTEEMRCEEDV